MGKNPQVGHRSANLPLSSKYDANLPPLPKTTYARHEPNGQTSAHHECGCIYGPVLCKVFAQHEATVIESTDSLLSLESPAFVVAGAGQIDVLVVNLAVPAPTTAVSEVADFRARCQAKRIPGTADLSLALSGDVDNQPAADFSFQNSAGHAVCFRQRDFLRNLLNRLLKYLSTRRQRKILAAQNAL